VSHSPTPCPQTPRLEEVYDVSRIPVPSTITSTSDLLREILSEIGDNPDINVVGDVRPPPGNSPPPAYKDLQESQDFPYSLVERTYVDVAFNATIARSSPQPDTNEHPSTTPGEPNLAYEKLEDPLRYNHALGERVISISQDSLLRPPVNIPIL